MKRNIMKIMLGALLIMALLAPVAVMEETPAGEPIAAEAVETNETPTEPDATPAEPDETPAEPDESPAEPDDTEEKADELIVAEAFEAAPTEAEDLDLAEAEVDPADQEIEYDLDDAGVSSEAADTVFETRDTNGNVTELLKDDFDPVVWENLKEVASVNNGQVQYGEHYDRNEDNKLDTEEMQRISFLILGTQQKWENNGWSFDDLGIQSLKGLELLPNLNSLNVSGNKQLGPTLNVSAFKKLNSLTCQGCGLTELILGTQSQLNKLSCNVNKMASLDISGCPLIVPIVDEANKQQWGGNSYQKQVQTEFGYDTYSLTYPERTDLILGGGNMIKATAIPITEANFPDPGFRNFLLDRYNNGEDAVSEKQLYEYSVDGMWVSKYWNDQSTDFGIKNVKGIELFKKLQHLYIQEYQLDGLDVSQNTELLSLGANDTGLTALDVSKNTKLQHLSVWTNKLSKLDVSNNTALIGLYCGENNLSELDVSKNSQLRSLECEKNSIATLDISGCSKEMLDHIDPKYFKQSDDKKINYYYVVAQDTWVDGDGNTHTENYDDIFLSCDASTKIIGGNPVVTWQEAAPANVSQPSSGTAASNEPQITIAKTPKSTKAKAGKKGRVTVTWKKIKKTKKTKALLGQIKSVQVQYSTDPNFAANVVTKSVSKKKTKVTLKLQKKTTYYIRVRYVGADGVSNWGAVKKVRTKK